MNDRLKHLLATHSHLWRGGDFTRGTPRRSSLDTGYSSLNKILHLGGWPRGGSSELYLPGQSLKEQSLEGLGIGELRLLLPALRNLADEGYICWVAPPCLPFAPALARQGVDLQRLLIVSAESPQQRLWAVEQALLSECCVAVFGWFGKAVLGLRELRRLQLAAAQRGVWSVLFRHRCCQALPSPSALRISLRPEPRGRLDIEVLKQPGGWAGQRLALSVAPHYEQWQRLPVALLPGYTANPMPVVDPGAAGSSVPASVTPVFPPAATSQPR